MCQEKRRFRGALQSAPRGLTTSKTRAQRLGVRYGSTAFFRPAHSSSTCRPCKPLSNAGPNYSRPAAFVHAQQPLASPRPRTSPQSRRPTRELRPDRPRALDGAMLSSGGTACRRSKFLLSIGPDLLPASPKFPHLLREPANCSSHRRRRDRRCATARGCCVAPPTLPRAACDTRCTGSATAPDRIPRNCRTRASISARSKSMNAPSPA